MSTILKLHVHDSEIANNVFYDEKLHVHDSEISNKVFYDEKEVFLV